MTVNKTLLIGVGVVTAGAGGLAIAYYYCPWQAAAAWSAGDEERAGMLTEYAFSLRDYGRLFAMLILAGLALMAYAGEPAAV